MKNKIVLISAIVLVVLLALFAFTACNTTDVPANQELVQNGTFAKFTDNKFEGWTTSSSSVKFSRQTKSGNSGDQYLCIDATSSLSYVYLKQTVSVATNKIYKVSVDVKTTNATSAQNGAHVAFLENEDYIFAGTNSTAGEWKTYTFYVRPKNTDYLTLALCIGSSETSSTGKVCYDNVSVQRVEEEDVPGDAVITNFRKSKTINTNQNAQGIALVVVTSLLAVALLIVAYVGLRRLYASKKAFVNFDNTQVDGGAKASTKATSVVKNSLFIGGIAMLVTFLIRLVLMLTLNGYNSAGNAVASSGLGLTFENFIKAVRTLGSSNGIGAYFASNNAYFTPGTMYILAIVGAMGKNIDGASISILIRFINALADMAVVAMIYAYGKKYVGNRTSLIFALLYAMLPFVFVTSGLSLSFESVLVALMLAALILLIEKKYLPSYLLITLAVVLDVRAMALAPIMIAYLAYMYYKDDKSLKKFTKNRAMIIFGLIGSFVLAYLLTLPITIPMIEKGGAFYGFTYMANQVMSTNFYVANALNLYGMVSMNGKSLSDLVKILNLVFTLVLELFAVSLYFKNRNRQEIILIASLTLALLAVFTLKVSFTFLFLSIALMIVYTMMSLDKRMYLVTAGYSVLGGISLTQMLNQSGLIANNATNKIMMFETTGAFYIFFCVLTVLLSGYFVYVVYSITSNTKIVDIKPMQDSVKGSIKHFFKNFKSKLSNIGKKSSEE